MRRWVTALLVLGAAVVLGAGCKKKQVPLEIEAGPVEVPQAEIDAKDAAKVIGSVYPLLCDANAAFVAWTSCRSTTTSFPRVFSCAERSLRGAKAALAALGPSTPGHAPCATEIQKASAVLLNAMPRYFGDLVKWLLSHEAKLSPSLEKMSLADACRTKKELCTDEPHDYDNAYKDVRMHDVDMIACTSQLFRCGESTALDCWLANVVPRLGVACDSGSNKRGTTPDDLLFVRQTGTPLAR